MNLETGLDPSATSDCNVFMAVRLACWQARDIDMIMMGALADVPFRERILGRLTRSLLDDVSVPLFLSH